MAKPVNKSTSVKYFTHTFFLTTQIDDGFFLHTYGNGTRNALLNNDFLFLTAKQTATKFFLHKNIRM